MFWYTNTYFNLNLYLYLFCTRIEWSPSGYIGSGRKDKYPRLKCFLWKKIFQYNFLIVFVFALALRLDALSVEISAEGGSTSIRDSIELPCKACSQSCLCIHTSTPPPSANFWCAEHTNLWEGFSSKSIGTFVKYAQWIYTCIHILVGDLLTKRIIIIFCLFFTLGLLSTPVFDNM